MKILHLIDSEGFYGAETVLVDLTAEQVQQGLNPTIVNLRPCPSGVPSIEAAASKRKVPFVIMPLKPGFDVRGAWSLVQYARKNNFDLIHCHGYKANILIGLIPKWLRKLPMVTTLHGWCSTEKYTKLWFFEQLDLFALKFVDAVVVVNKAMLNHPFLQNSRLNIQVVNNGIPPIDFAPVASLDQNVVDFCTKHGFVLGAIGRLSQEKGFDLLLEALAQLVKQGENTYLIIIGEGEEHSNLEVIIEQHGLQDRVLLAGYRDGARNYLPLFDLFVMPSLTEGLPITLLEAMQAKVPIVATEVGGIPEVLKQGEAGILIPPGDIDQLKNSIALIAANEQLKNRIVEKAAMEVSRKYSTKNMANNYFSVYQQVSSLG